MTYPRFIARYDESVGLEADQLTPYVATSTLEEEEGCHSIC